MNSLNLVKFDVKRHEANKYFQKSVKLSFVMDFDQVRVVPDYYKYYIMVASSNIILGFTMGDETEPFRFDRSSGPIRPFSDNMAYFRDYRYYELESSFKCIHPALILFSAINHQNRFCVREPPKKEKQAGLSSVQSCKLCATPHGVLFFLQFPLDKFSFVALDKADIMYNFKKMSLKIFSMLNYTEIINSRARLYLQTQMRSFRFKFVAYKMLVLEFDKYFPYELARVSPVRARNLEIDSKTHKRSRVVYPKALRVAPILGGFISKRYNGNHILNLFLIQKGRNILLSNVFQSAISGDAEEEFAGHSYLAHGAETAPGGRFSYRVSKYRQANPRFEVRNAKRFSPFVQMLESVFGQFLDSFGKSDFETRAKVLDRFKDIKKEDLGQRKMDKVVSVGFQDNQLECRSLVEQGLFGDRSNLMELGNVKGNRADGIKRKTGPSPRRSRGASTWRP